MRGFTVIEFLLVTAIFAVLTAIATVNLFSFQHKTQITTSVDTFITDLKEQQTKAMVGDTEGRTSNSTYGINMASTSYILFHGTFSSSEASNFAVDLPNTMQVSTTFPNSQINFEGGSGEVIGYASSSASITLRDIVTNEQRILQINKYGIVTSVN